MEVRENLPIECGGSCESTNWWWQFVRINQMMVAIREYHPIDGGSSFESTNWWWRFIQGLLGKNEKKLAWFFNFTFRYIDDVFSLNNSRFVDFVDRIYPIELEIKDTTDTDRSASYLDLHLDINSKWWLRMKIYDTRDDFNFSIVNFPFICRNIPAAPTNGVYISQLIRYSRAWKRFAANKEATEPRVPLG